MIFAMASRFVVASGREIAGACALLALAIAVIVAGAFLPDVFSKAIFLGGLIASTGIVAWRFLLEAGERSQIIGFLPPTLRPAFAKVADWR